MFGVLNDRVGRRISYFSCLATLLFGSFLTVMSPDFWTWAASRVIVGLTIPAVYQIPFIIGKIQMEILSRMCVIFQFVHSSRAGRSKLSVICYHAYLHLLHRRNYDAGRSNLFDPRLGHNGSCNVCTVPRLLRVHLRAARITKVVAGAWSTGRSAEDPGGDGESKRSSVAGEFSARAGGAGEAEENQDGEEIKDVWYFGFMQVRNGLNTSQDLIKLLYL